MPIYEYRCAQCAHELEIMQKMSDEPLTQCPECGHHSLDKLISRSSFRLKGGGWYETDFKNATPPQKTETPTSPSSASAPVQTEATETPSASAKSEASPAPEKHQPAQKKPVSGDS